MKRRARKSWADQGAVADDLEAWFHLFLQAQYEHSRGGNKEKVPQQDLDPATLGTQGVL